MVRQYMYATISTYLYVYKKNTSGPMYNNILKIVPTRFAYAEFDCPVLLPLPPASPVACTEPGAPDDSVTAEPGTQSSSNTCKTSAVVYLPDSAGGFVELSFVATYASSIGLFRQVTTGTIV